jgi:NADPH2 dehydrogenase
MEQIVYSPFSIGSLQLKNRIIKAPMQQYQGSPEGFATDHHVKYYGERARDVGLVIIESTAVSLNGRLFPNDIGIFTDEHIPPLKRVVDAVHRQGTPVFIQLSHGGRKSYKTAQSRLLAPSRLAYDEEHGLPEAMSLEDIQNVIEEFRLAARRSREAGFDGIEMHAAHGFLLHQFLSPLSNKRTDAYGGPLTHRVRLLQEVLAAIRNEVEADYPVQIRVSASDYVRGGLHPQEVGEAMHLLEPLQIDAVHVSSGALLPLAPLAVYPGYQVPYAAMIRRYVQIPVIAVGLIYTLEMIEQILQDHLADFVAIGRPLSDNPHFVEELLYPEKRALCA